jgi:hypothetical protein
MNGVAREFWAEIYDLRLPAAEPRDERRERPVRAKVRKLLVRRPARRPLR